MHPGVAAAGGPAAVPSALLPSGQVPYARFRASGVQIYECAAKSDAPGGYAWQFRAPEATLTDAAGVVVRHGAGPSWSAPDGSRIVGKTSASVPAPGAGAVAWLLLSVSAHEGHGLFDKATSVQRVDTAGGVAPASACGAGDVGQVERVPYTASYVFWQANASSH
jgi:hypothetical protein